MQRRSSAKTSYLGILDVKTAGNAKYTGMNCSCCQYAAPVQCPIVQAQGVLTKVARSGKSASVNVSNQPHVKAGQC